MANLPVAFTELLVGGILLDYAIRHGQSAVSGSGVQAASGASGGSGSYINPVPGATASRVDQGVDYTLGPKGFLAPGKAKILVADQSNSGWAGGGYVAYQLLDGPLKGSIGFIAEGIRPLVKVNEIVRAGQNLVQRVASPYNGTVGNIEAGWANPNNPRQPLAQSFLGYGGDQSSQAITAGSSWNNFVRAAGGVVGRIEAGAGSIIASLAGTT